MLKRNIKKGGQMKPRKLNKKLYLSKKTIADLDYREQEKIKGGYFNTNCDQTCYTWCGACQSRPQVCGYTPDFTNGPSCL